MQVGDVITHLNGTRVAESRIAVAVVEAATLTATPLRITLLDRDTEVETNPKQGRGRRHDASLSLLREE